MKTIRVEWQEDDSRRRYWVAPEHGHSVVKLELESPKRRITSILVPHFHAEFGHWFPTHYEVIETEVPGGKVIDHTATEIQVVSLNRTIPAERFEVETFGLPQNTRVHDHPRKSGTPVYVDGAALRTGLEIDVDTEAGMRDSEKKRPWLRIAGVVLMVLAVIAGAQYFLRRRSKLA